MALFWIEELLDYFLIPKAKLVIRHSVRFTFMLFRWVFLALYKEVKSFWVRHKQSILNKILVTLFYLFFVFTFVSVSLICKHFEQILDLLGVWR